MRSWSRSTDRRPVPFRKASKNLSRLLSGTLTLHRLGVFEEVGRSLKTTNAIENLNSLVEDYLGKVKRWHHSEQRARWFALGLLEAEQRMNRTPGTRTFRSSETPSNANSTSTKNP
jgi:transposase-like protein